MDRKSSTLAAAALAALLASGHAAAQGSGWYIGGGPSASRAKFERADFVGLSTGAYSVDDSDAGAKGFGGYRITPNWAVEFGVTAIGRFEHRFDDGANGRAKFHYDASAATVAIAGTLPLGGGLSLIGRLGAAFTAARIRLASATGNVATTLIAQGWGGFFDDDRSTTRTNVLWGAGAQYDINPRWGLRLDYDNYGKIGDQFETGRAKADAWSANVVFRF